MIPHKYPRTKHLPFSPEIHADDKTHDHPEFFLNKEVVISEKIDGGNCLLWKGDVYARSTGQKATQGWFDLVKRQHAWKTKDLAENIFTYGEDIYGIHSLEYDPIKENESYRIFNVRKDDTWYSWDDVIQHASNLDIATVPVLYRGAFHRVNDIAEWCNTHITQKSAIGPELEGFVIRIVDSFHNEQFQDSVAKFVRKNHVQTSEHWTKNWQPAKLIKND